MSDSTEISRVKTPAPKSQKRFQIVLLLPQDVLQVISISSLIQSLNIIRLNVIATGYIYIR